MIAQAIRSNKMTFAHVREWQGEFFQGRQGLGHGKVPLVAFNRLNADNSPLGIPRPAPEPIAVIAGLRRLDHLVVSCDELAQRLPDAVTMSHRRDKRRHEPDLKIPSLRCRMY